MKLTVYQYFHLNYYHYRMNQDSNDIKVMKALSIDQDTGKVFVADSIDFELMKVRIPL